MTQETSIGSLGKAIWSIFIEEADYAVFRIKLFEGLSGEGTISFFRKGSLIKDSLAAPLVPDGYINSILRPIAYELQRTPPFDRQPFTHMRYELTSDGKVNVDFAYIPEWDSWPGLFMQGVSELTEAEARDPAISNTWGIDYEHWEKCRARRQQKPYEK